MPRNPDLLAPILDAKDDFTICPHITRLEVRADGGKGQVQYYQEQPAFTPAGVPFSETNATSGEVYQRLEAKSTSRDDFVLVPEGVERERIIKILRTAPNREYGLYTEIDGKHISLRGGSSPSLALYTHNETRELWIGKSELLDAGAREGRLELLDALERGATKNALLKERVAYDIFAYYGASVPRLSIASAQARYKCTEIIRNVYDDRQAWHWHIFSRWLDKFRTYGYLPKFIAADSHFSLVIDDRQIRERGLGHILAVAHFINDVDAMNNGGNNVGYQLKTDAQGELYAQSYKIDPAYAFTNCQEEKPETYNPTWAIHVSNFDVVFFDDLPKATRAEFIETLQLIAETPDKDIESFFNRGSGLSFTHIPEPNNLDGPTFVNSSISMLKARRNALRQLFIEELQATKTANAAQKPPSKPAVNLPPELAPIYTQMQFEQADPLIRKSHYFYIPPNTTCSGYKTEPTEPLQAIMDAFLSDNTQRILLLLGDSGFGKSTITKIFYQAYWERYLTNLSLPQPAPHSQSGLISSRTDFFRKAPTNSSLSGETQKNRIILRIDLKQFSERTVLRCVDNTLIDNFYLSAVQIIAFKQHPCLIILDGFDEIAGCLKCNLWQTNQLQTWRDVKLLITCRSVYLEQNDLAQYFYPTLQDAQAFVKRHLAPFTLSQIETYLQQALQDMPVSGNLEIKQSQPDVKRTAIIIAQITTSKALQELLEVPLMLKIFTDALPTLEQQGSNLAELNRYSLYQAFMQQWFNRHRDRLSQHLGQAINKSICERFLTYSEDLAFELFKANCLELDYAPGQVPWDRFFSQSDTESIYLRSGCPLRRIGNRYSFIHKSFLEFFVAQFILRHCDNPQLSTELTVSLDHRALTDEPQIILFLQQAHHAQKTPPAFAMCLEAIVLASVQQPAIATASSNAASLLNGCDVNLTQKKWAGVQLPGADLRYSVLAHSDLSRANLRGARLDHAVLYHVDLKGADLRDVSWGEFPHLNVMEFDALAHHPTHPWLAITQENSIVLIHRDTGEEIGKAMDGHTDTVKSVAFSLDGVHLVSGSEDSTLRLWNVQTQSPIGFPMSGHTSRITSLAFSSDGTCLASGSWDNTLRLWDVQTQSPIGLVMCGHTDKVTSIAFSPDGKCLLSGSEDNTLRLWNTRTQSCIGATMSEHTDKVTSVAFSPDGTRYSQEAMIRLFVFGMHIPKLL